MSLYGDYIKERDNKSIIEDENGFMSFMFIDADTCYVEEMYIRPEARNLGHAKVLFKMVEDLAKQQGCKNIVGSVKPSANGSTDSLKVILTAGFQLLRANNDAIFLIKGVDDGLSRE